MPSFTARISRSIISAAERSGRRLFTPLRKLNDSIVNSLRLAFDPECEMAYALPGAGMVAASDLNLHMSIEGPGSSGDARFSPGKIIRAQKIYSDGSEVTAEYQIIRVLSDEGGMSQVFDVVEKGLPQEYVLKVMNFNKIDTDSALLEQLIQRFRVETDILMKLNHPNIVRVIARDVKKYPEFYIMEKIECQPTLEIFEGLRKAIFAETDPIEQRKKSLILMVRCLFIMSHTLQGLIAFGERMKQIDPNARIAHRDLKPENILFRREDNGVLTGVLTDFGIAKIPELAKDDKNLTETGAIIGTHNYIAPETAISGAKVADQSSDVFSLGVIMCELLAGYIPFEFAMAENWSYFLADAAFPRNLNAYIDSMRQNRPNYLPGNIWNIVLKALDPIQRNRFRTYEELKATLDPIALALVEEYNRLQTSSSAQ